ncbi:MAG: isopeptide-forming domain-containing fimbrial protein [Firmicutes bacterium]|nr:isopeptide-forming domain-containing fimbrial protein [Bacillota bacterium]
MKKLTSILLIFAMVLGMATASFAGTVKNGTEGHSYKAYQIFSGTQAAGSSELAKVEWGNGVDSSKLLTKLKKDYDYFDSCDSAAKVADVLKNKADDCEEAKALANAAAACLAGEGTAIAAGAGEVSLAAGYYLLVDVTANLGGTHAARNSALLQVTGDEDIKISAKYDVPKVTKMIDENGADVTSNEAFIGEVVKYQITGTLPSNIADYEEYFYRFADTLGKGLTYNNDATVSVNGVDVTDYFYIGASAYSATDGTNIVVAMQDLLALELLKDDDERQVVGNITSSTTVVLEYTAVLNNNAVIAGAGNPNVVDLEFSNDPNNSGNGSEPPVPPTTPPTPDQDEPSGKTPKQSVVTYTTAITINKVDQNQQALSGAEFTLTGSGTSIDFIIRKGQITEMKDGFEYRQVGKVNENGQFTFTGLGAGEYTLEETIVPDGYNRAANITFEITFDRETKTFDVVDDDGKVNDADSTLSVQVVNEKGIVLPETGGMGTTIFYIVGTILLVGAAVAFITKRRMNR